MLAARFDIGSGNPIQTKTVIGGTFTAHGSIVLNLTDGARLILPKHPSKNDVILFTKDESVITIDSNGRKLNGNNGITTFRKPRLARQIFYFFDVDEWFIL